MQQISQSAGGVLGPADTLMLVVPDGEPLILEARIEPQHIDQVHAGDGASIRLTSFSATSTPELPARIDRLSADVEIDSATGAHFCVARVRRESLDLPP